MISQATNDQSFIPGTSRPASAFTRYFVGQGTSMIGDGTVAVTYAFAALVVTGSGWAMPAVLLGLWTTRMLFMNAGGRAADRRNRAAVIMWADVVRLGAQAFTAVCFLIGDPQLWQLMVSAVVYGAATAFFVPASIAMLPQLVPPERLQKVNSRLGVIRNVGVLVGPAIAAGLYSLGGVALALGFDIVTFAVSVLCLASIVHVLHRPAPRADDDTVDDTDDDVSLLGAFGVLARFPLIAWIVLVWCMVQIGVASVNVLGPLVARDALGGVDRWSVLAIGAAVGGLLGSALAGSLRTTRPTIIIVLLLGSAMPLQLLGMAWWTNVIVLAFLFALTSVALAVCGVLFDTYLQTRLDESILGRVGAAESGLTSAMIPFGLVISLPLAKLVGFHAYLTGTAVLIVGLAVLAIAVTKGAPSAAPIESPALSGRVG